MSEIMNNLLLFFCDFDKNKYNGGYKHYLFTSIKDGQTHIKLDTKNLFVFESKKPNVKEDDKIILNVSKTVLTTATFGSCIAV
jgi:hypothetical protein